MHIPIWLGLLAKHIPSYRREASIVDPIDKKDSLDSMKQQEYAAICRGEVNPSETSMLAVVILDAFRRAEAEKRRIGGRRKNAPYRLAEQHACELAQRLWTENPNLTKNDIVEKIRPEVEGKCARKFTDETLRKWITPVMPVARRAGGRPRKKKTELDF